MPFRGTGGRSAIDTSVYKLLFDESARRDEQRRAILNDVMKFQAEQQAAAEQAKKDQVLHDLEVRKRELEIKKHENDLFAKHSQTMDTLFGQMSAAGIDENTIQARRQSLVNSIAPGAMFADLNSSEEPVPAYGPLNPATAAQDLSQARAIQGELANNPTGTVFDRELGILGGQMGESPTSVLARTMNRGAVGERAAQEELSQKIADEKRQSALIEGRERRGRDQAADIAARSGIAEAKAYQNEITRLGKAVDRETDPARREELKGQLAAITAQRDADLYRSTPGEFIQKRYDIIEKQDKYARGRTAMRFLAVARDHPEILGAGPFASQYAENLIGVVGNIMSIVGPEITKALEDPNLGKNERALLNDYFVQKIDPNTRLPLQEAQIQQVGLKWLLANGLDKRPTKYSVEEFANLTKLSGLMVSDETARTRANALYTTLARQLAEQERPALAKLGVTFDSNGDIEGYAAEAAAGHKAFGTTPGLTIGNSGQAEKGKTGGKGSPKIAPPPAITPAAAALLQQDATRTR